MRRPILLALPLCALPAACSGQPGWRTRETAAAEAKVRELINDPAATFSAEQVTGDDQTGQTCGVVHSHTAAPRRFVVYIDGTAGPFIEGGQGTAFNELFDRAWTNDCLDEGYKPPR